MSPGVSDSFTFAERDSKPSEPNRKTVHICSDIENKHIKIIIRGFHLNDQGVFSWDHKSGTKRKADSLCEGEDKFTTPKKTRPPDEVKVEGNAWVPELGLQAKDRTILVDGDWLTDNHIVAGQRLLSRQFPALEGLQEPVLGNVLQFKPIVSDGVQVMQNGNSHWVTLFKTGGSVKVMDSKNMGLTRQLTHQVVNLCEGDGDDDSGTWEVRLPRMHRQRGSSDCGVFALAYATELAFKGDPELVVYEQKGLRPHLKDCLEAMEMSPFPKKVCKERTPREIGKRTQIVKKMVPTYPSPIAPAAGFERSP